MVAVAVTLGAFADAGELAPGALVGVSAAFDLGGQLGIGDGECCGAGGGVDVCLLYTSPSPRD